MIELSQDDGSYEFRLRSLDDTEVARLWREVPSSS